MEFHRQALAISFKIFKKDHPEIAAGYNNIGRDYAAKNRYDDAILFYKKSLDIKSKKIKDNYRYISNTLINLGVAYQKKGFYDEAVAFADSARSMRTTLFGELHPKVAQAYYVLGDIACESYLEISIVMNICS